MKKFFWIFSIAAMSLAIASCDEKKPHDVDNITEDGFYVVGEATGQSQVTNLLAMAKGINEWGDDNQNIKAQQLRDGMYEKYIVLEGGKEFTLAYVEGGKQNAYGADLKAFKPEAFTGPYEDNPDVELFKGTLVVGDAAPKMKMAQTGLYHIVLDLNKDKLLNDAQILVSPVTWGVRGGMNSWGFTAMEATAPSNDGITYTISGQELAKEGKFKFAYNGGWKIYLGGNADNTQMVKANTNLGTDCEPGGSDIVVADGAGKYKITLTYKLAAGDLKNSFKYEIQLESASSAPETMYMIGKQWGDWAWESDGIVELVPVWGAAGHFWCTRWFDASMPFKFCAQKAWNGDFTGSGAVGYTLEGGNCKLAESGFYTVYVNGNDNEVEITPAVVCGMGNALFAGGWDYNDAEQFVADGDKLVITTKGVVGNEENGFTEELRLGSKVQPSQAVEGITGNGWFDWWKTEFIFYEDGKIVYRGAGDDQARVRVGANKKITLDLNAGTATIEDAGGAAAPITIDGNMSDWAAIEGVTEGTHTFKAISDDTYIYLYSMRSTEKRYSDIWGGVGYIYFGFDLDNNSETGDGEKADWGTGKWETLILTYPYGGSVNDKKIVEEMTGDWWVLPATFTINNLTFKGCVSDAGAEVEFRIPRADIAEIPASEITIKAWGNKDLSTATLKCTL
ncbi:MAG: SusF/SusE family outer membrane protein [Bacteroidales bacterium]|nr:SusF/SusE family outer membrane protein [Bacteroidales bacterium]